MLESSFRLKKKEIVQLFKKGRIFRYDSFFFRIAFNQVSHSRLAIIIPKKVSAKATVRNRLKRKVMIALSSQDKIKDKNIDLAIFFKEIPAEKEIESLLKAAITKALGEK